MTISIKWNSIKWSFAAQFTCKIIHFIISFISTWHHNITMKSFLSLLSERREMSKHGGLDSRDQSRSRTSLASRLTFLKCRDFLDCRDRLSASVEIESLDRDKNKNRDKSRLYSIEIVEICRDVIFQTVEKILTVEMSFFKLSRKSRPSRPALCQCRDRESRSRQIETPRATISFCYKFSELSHFEKMQFYIMCKHFAAMISSLILF